MDLSWLEGNGDPPWLDDMAFHEFMMMMNPTANRGRYLVCTGGYLVKRWERKSALEDLNRAIELSNRRCQ